MAKSLRSKREKRLRTLRREIATPFYDNKDAAKLKAQEAALAAPKLPIRRPNNNNANMITDDDPNPTANSNMDVEMADGSSFKSQNALKPVGGVGKKLKKGWKLRKMKRKAKGKKNMF